MGPALAAAGVAVAAALLLAAAAVHAEASVYPCSSCHAELGFKPDRKASREHGVNLTVGAHSGLSCISCHDPSTGMMTLRGGVNISDVLLGGREGGYRAALVCAECHRQVYEDWLALAHGNATYTCPGGSAVEVLGYGGAPYYLHECPEGTGYEAVQAQPCTACHDPHDPVMEPLGVLERPGDRPEPPPQGAIVAGGLASVAAGLSLIALAAWMGLRGAGRP